MEYKPNSPFIKEVPSYKSDNRVTIGDAIFKGDEFAGHVTAVTGRNITKQHEVEVSDEYGSQVVTLGRSYHQQYVYPFSSFVVGDLLWRHDWDDYSVACVVLANSNGQLAIVSLETNEELVIIISPNLGEEMYSSVQTRKMSAEDALSFKDVAIEKMERMEGGGWMEGMH